MVDKPQVSELLLRDMQGNDLVRMESAVNGVLTIRERTKRYRAELLPALYDAAHIIERTIRHLQEEV